MQREKTTKSIEKEKKVNEKTYEDMKKKLKEKIEQDVFQEAEWQRYRKIYLLFPSSPIQRFTPRWSDRT